MIFLLLLQSIAASRFPLNFAGEPFNISLAIQSSQMQVTNPCIRLVSALGNSTECAVVAGSLPGWAFFTLQRPNWTLGASPAKAAVFVGSFEWAAVEYILSPTLSNQTVSSEVAVRSFFRPGWSAELARLTCTNCSTHNILVIASQAKDACEGRPQERNFFAHSMLKLVDPSLSFFESGNVEISSISFWTHSDARLSTDERRVLMSIPLQLCFYESVHAVRGTLVGSVDFMPDSGDAEVFVFLILFFLLFYPLMCIITWALNAAKMKRVLTCMRDIKDHIQTQQLEYELMPRP